MDRKERIRSMFNPSGAGLEIGPSFNPIVTKGSGARVEILDHATTEQIRAKYAADRNVTPAQLEQIEEIDYVSDGRSMVDLIGKRECYDYIVASHVIEHTPDMIGFLNDCEALLKPDGVLVLAVPDKRYCFDVLRTLTSIGDLLDAYRDRRTRHTPGAVFDFASSSATRGGAIGWPQTAEGSLTFSNDIAAAFRLFQEVQETDDYRDIHAWRFTPSSFRMIVRNLKEAQVLGLREQEFHPTEGHEFYIALSRSGAGCPHDRLTLAQMALVEERAIIVDAKLEAAHPRHELVQARAEAARRDEEIARPRAEIRQISMQRDALVAQVSSLSVASTNAVGRVGRKICNLWQQRRDAALLAKSELFNADWYRRTYPDVAVAGLDPYLHYLRHGAAEGRNPSPLFDTREYLSRNPDVAAMAVNPLVYHLRHRISEKRKTARSNERPA
jgi:hypothetical protein